MTSYFGDGRGFLSSSHHITSHHISIIFRHRFGELKIWIKSCNGGQDGTCMLNYKSLHSPLTWERVGFGQVGQGVSWWGVTG